MEVSKSIPFKIFPSIGFKNSSFQLNAFENNITIEIFKDDKKINSFLSKINNPIIITELKEPGDYIAKCFINGKIFSQSIKVEDLLRWGSSIFKKAFVFDEIDYSFYLMKDRMFIYDEIKKTTFLENKLSPSEIYKIDNKHLLFITHKGDDENKKSNFALFSLESFSIISELLNDFIEISYNQETNFLYAFEQNNKCINCFDFNENFNFTPKFKFDKVISFTKNESKNYLLIKQIDNVIFVNFNTNETYKYPINDNTLIDYNGNLLEKIDSNIYLTNLIQRNEKKKIDLPINLNIENKLNNLFHIGISFTINQEYNDFENRVERIVENHNETITNNTNYQKFYLNNIEDKISIENTIHEIIFMRNKIMIFEIHTTEKLQHIKYNVVNGELSKKPDFTIINTYKLIDLFDTNTNFIRYNNCTGIELLNEDFLSIKYFGISEIFCNGQLLEVPDNTTQTRILDLPSLDYSYLLLIKDQKFQLFSSNEFIKCLAHGKSIYNIPYLSKHKTIWYSNLEDDRLTGFSLINKETIPFTENHYSTYNFNEDFFTSSNKDIFNPFTGELKNTIIGNLLSFSDSFEKTISRRNNVIFLTIKNYLTNLVSTHEIKVEEQLYEESYLSPNGNFLMFKKNDNSYFIYDVRNANEQVFVSDNFVRFNSNNQIEINDSEEPRTIKIIDPETFETISYKQSDLYEFQSPDGKLYASSRMKTQYVDLLNNKEINLVEYNKLLKVVSENNVDFFNHNKKALFNIGIKKSTSLWLYKHKIISQNKFIKIGITGTSISIDIEIPNNINYYNYAAFSFDNKYLSIVGKPISQGIILIVNVDFDVKRNKVIEIDRFISYLPNNATWTCGFSKKGQFATYDSKPNTYLLDCNDDLFNKNSKLNTTKGYDLRNLLYNFNKIENLTLIRGKNYLTFSPSGNYIALSEQGYDPLSLGGFGHQESESVHIFSIKSNKIIDSFFFHGEPIKYDKIKKLTFVSFSEDETKMLSLGTDGVIYLRNLNLN